MPLNILVVLGCRLDTMVTIDLRRPMALDAERMEATRQACQLAYRGRIAPEVLDASTTTRIGGGRESCAPRRDPCRG